MDWLWAAAPSFVWGWNGGVKPMGKVRDLKATLTTLLDK